MEFKDNWFMEVLFIFAICAGVFVFLTGMGLFIMWIKYSWLERTNSAGYTGETITQDIFDNNDVSVEIKSSYFYAKYWNHNKRKNTYRLRGWTFRRSSIWTMMEASQQAYATVIREKKTKTFWGAFRLPKLISFGGSLIGFGIIAWVFYSAKETGLTNISTYSWDMWLKISLGLSIALLTMLYAMVYRAYTLKKNVVPMLRKSTKLSEDELIKIQRIFKWAFIYAIGQSLLQTLRVILEIFSESSSKKNK